MRILLAEKPSPKLSPQVLVSTTPKVDAEFTRLTLEGADYCEQLLDMAVLARTLERELNKANEVIAAAKDYVEEFKEFWPEDTTLIAILEGRMPSINKKEISKT